MPTSRIILTVFISFLSLTQKAQTTIILQPGPDDGKDVLISINVPNSSYPYAESISIYTWTNGGSVGIERSLIEFDFSSIPENAEIISAELSLYYNPTDEWQSFDYHTGDNAAYIQRILEPWDQYSVTWNNKPELSAENQVWLAPSTSPTQDYLNIDVVEMVRDMLVSPSGNNGFSIRMENEQDPYRSLLFASSNHPFESIRPEIEIRYIIDTGIDLEVNLGDDTTLCQSDELLLDVTFPDATYLWQDNTNSATYNVTQPGIYWVVVSVNGSMVSDTIVVQYIEIPSIDLGSDTIMCENETLILNAFYSESNYSWQDYSTDSTFGVFQTGNYWVEVNNQCGFVIDSINVVYEDCECHIYVPNVFTPNGDGKNDEFNPVFECEFRSYHLIIFNRWGNLIFETGDENASWNGIINGVKAPEGVYLYVLTYEPRNNISQQVSGNITLIR